MESLTAEFGGMSLDDLGLEGGDTSSCAKRFLSAFRKAHGGGDFCSYCKKHFTHKKDLVKHLSKNRKHVVSSKQTKAHLKALTAQLAAAERRGENEEHIEMLKRQRLLALFAAVVLVHLHGR